MVAGIIRDVLNLGTTTTTRKTIMFNAFIQKIKFTEHLLGQSRSIKRGAYSQEVSIYFGEIRQIHGLKKKKKGKHK